MPMPSKPMPSPMGRPSMPSPKPSAPGRTMAPKINVPKPQITKPSELGGSFFNRAIESKEQVFHSGLHSSSAPKSLQEKTTPNSLVKPVKEQNEILKGIGLTRAQLKGVVKSSRWYDPYSGSNLSKSERVAEVDKEFKDFKRYGSNISKSDVQKMLHSKSIIKPGLEKQLYDKRNTGEAPKIRKEIKFWKKIIGEK